MNRERKILLNIVILVIALCMAAVSYAAPMGTAFTYQGWLMDKNNNKPADGLHDFEFSLFAEPSDANQVGGTISKDNVNVQNGFFAVSLDFSAGDPNAFNGDARWLEISVRPDGSGSFTTLTPRQEVTPTPYALHTRGIFVDADGNVGIGTKNPDALLQVGEDTFRVVRQPDNRAGIDDRTPDAKLEITPDGTATDLLMLSSSPDTDGDLFIVTNNGNIGIGTTSPEAKLTINGAILRDGSTMYGAYTDTHINLGLASVTGRNGQDYTYATVSGGKSNTASQESSSVGGGQHNDASGEVATIGGGDHNEASGHYAAISGGSSNAARDVYATVGGGHYNNASFCYTTVSGGQYNTAGGYDATVGGGSHNTASGDAATIPGGSDNIAGGDCSFAAGCRAIVRDAAETVDDDGDEGTFVWADSTDADFKSTGPDQFLIRASGGVGIGTTSPAHPLHMESGAHCTSGGTWTNASDRNQKENITAVDGRKILKKLNSIPISTWNYKAEDASIRHVGPMAQDLYASFGFGDSDKSITTIDADGISFAAIQGLYQLAQEKDAEIVELKERLAKMEATVGKLINSNNGGQL